MGRGNTRGFKDPVLGPLLFNIYLNNLFYLPLLFNIYLNNLFYLSESTEVCNFADNTTFYSCHEELRSLIIDWNMTVF